MTLFFILPAYNESENIAPLLEKIRALQLSKTVVLVDDGSSDDTLLKAESLKNMNELLIEKHSRNLGLGEAVRTGLRKALSLMKDDDLIVVMDSDNSHPPDLVHEMIRKIEEGADVVIASRYAPGGKEVGLSPFRKALSHACSLFLKIFFPIRNVRDYTCALPRQKERPEPDRSVKTEGRLMINFFALFPFLAVLLLFLFPRSRSITLFMTAVVCSALSVLIGIHLDLLYPGLIYVLLFLFAGLYTFPLEREMNAIIKDENKKEVETLKEIEKGKILLDEWDKNSKKLTADLEAISKRYAFGESLVRNLDEKPILQELFRSISKKTALAFSFFTWKRDHWSLVHSYGNLEEHQWRKFLQEQELDQKSAGRSPYSIFPASENRTLIFVPVIVQDEKLHLLGFFLENPVPPHFVEEVMTYAQLLRMGLQKVSLCQAVVERSRTDGLTHFYLRRIFLERIQEEITFSKRYGTSFSLLMLDLDHFKKVNDTYGHPVGDLVLKSVADSLRTLLHPGVTICRYGGEEFAILIGLAPANQVSKDAEKIRKEISELEIPVPPDKNMRSEASNEPRRTEEEKIQITLCVGVTHFLPDAPAIEELIKRADTALYQAKKSGRNRVVEWKK